VAPGTSALYVRLFPLILEPDDRLLLPRPYYPLYLYAACLAHAIPLLYDIDPRTGDINLDAFEAAAHTEKPRLILINSPGNPIGNILSPIQMERIAEIARRHQAFLWSDETYGNMDFTGEWRSLTAAVFDSETTIVTAGFSKGYRMYQRRVGYCLTKSRMVKQLLEPALQNTVLTTDPAAQYGALEALAHPECVAELRELYGQRAQHLMRAWNAKTVDVIEPKGGFNVLLDCRKALRAASFRNSVELARDILNKAFVAVTPGLDFGLDGYLRLTLTSKRFPEAVARLNRCFKGDLP
jgi:aspartate aminotransferase